MCTQESQTEPSPFPHNIPCPAAEKYVPALSRTTLVSRNITILGHRTSVRLEPEMWTSLRDIERREGKTIHEICSAVFLRKEPETSLTAAIRVFLLMYYRSAATEEGHARAHHGSLRFGEKKTQVSDLRWSAVGKR